MGTRFYQPLAPSVVRLARTPVAQPRADGAVGASSARWSAANSGSEIGAAPSCTTMTESQKRPYACTWAGCNYATAYTSHLTVRAELIPAAQPRLPAPVARTNESRSRLV